MFWSAKRQEEVKGVPISLKDTWESAFLLGLSLIITTEMSQYQRGFFHFTALEPEQHPYASTVLQHTLICSCPGSRVAALLSRGSGSLLCCSLSPSTAGVDRQSPQWWGECLGQPILCAWQLLSWQRSWRAEESARLDAAPRCFSSLDGRGI